MVGQFNDPGNGIAKFNTASGWTGVDGGLTYQDDYVTNAARTYVVAADADPGMGAVYVVGDFNYAGEVQAPGIARWVTGLADPGFSCDLTFSGGVLASDSFSFTVTGQTGSHWIVEASRDLVNWWTVGLGSVTLWNGSTSVIDSPLNGDTYRFYRLRNNCCCSHAYGFMQVTAQLGQSTLIANQLDAPPNTLSSLMPDVPPGTQLQKLVGGGWQVFTFDDIDRVWYPNGDTTTLAPGEGALILPSAIATEALTLTFIGNVKDGHLVEHISGTSICSSPVPQSGRITTDLGYPARPGDQIQLRQNNGYTGYCFDDVDMVWYPSEPVIGVGESFWITPVSPVDWVRDFSVCP